MILLYHRVVERETDPLGVCVSPENFAGQLEVLRATREVVPPAQLLVGDAPSRAAAVTFDDGYRDNLEHAAPALAATGMPATLFVATGAVAEGGGFWWDDLEHLLRTAPPDAASSLTLELARQRRTFRLGGGREREIAHRHRHAWLQPLAPEEIGSALAALRRWAGESGRPPERDRAMTPGGCERSPKRPWSRSAPTPAHTAASVTPTVRTQDAELAGSRDDLAAWLGTEPSAFSYPFGVPGADFDDALPPGCGPRASRSQSPPPRALSREPTGSSSHAAPSPM